MLGFYQILRKLTINQYKHILFKNMKAVFCFLWIFLSNDNDLLRSKIKTNVA